MGLLQFIRGGSSHSTTSATSTISNRNIKSVGYEQAIALDAPVRGSYPVAGNGPNVLDELQRSRARKDTEKQLTNISKAPPPPLTDGAEPPNIARKRGSTTNERPQTASQDAGTLGRGRDTGFVPFEPKPSDSGRTRSGFTTRSPPVSLLHSKRRHSLRSFSVETSPNPAPKTSLIPPFRVVRAYKPTTGFEDRNSLGSAPSYQTHQRSDSRASYKSYVDLLEAQSNFRPSQQASRHRANASGTRNYGEDVADRNMSEFARPVMTAASGNVQLSSGGKAFDINSPEFSYMKTVYSAKNPGVVSRCHTDVARYRSRTMHPTGDPRTDSTLGHILDTPVQPIQAQVRSIDGDDTATAAAISPIRSMQPHRPPFALPVAQSKTVARDKTVLSSEHSAASSRFSPASVRSRSVVAVTPTTTTNTDFDRSSSLVATSRARADPLAPTNSVDHGVRAAPLVLPSSPSTASLDRKGVFDNSPAPPIPPRGRDRTARRDPPPGAQSPTSTPLVSPIRVHNPRPTPIASLSHPKATPPREEQIHTRSASALATRKLATSTTRSEARKGASVSFSSEPPQSIQPARYPPPSLEDRKRAMATEVQIAPVSAQVSTAGSSSHSPYPSRGPQGNFEHSGRSSMSKRREMLVENAKEPPSLKGVVDLKNTVDTEVTTKTLSAVVHETVIPTRHEIREERITREIHYHDVYHRILPVIDTVILPTKHYILAPDHSCVIEIPGIDVPKYTGRPLESINQGWKLVRTNEPASHRQNDSLGHGNGIQLQSKPRLTTTNSEQLIDQFQSYDPYIDQENGSKTFASAQHSDPSYVRNTSSSSPFATSQTSVSPRPVLTSKKTYTSKEGYPRTEYTWHHPPVFEDNQGRTQQIYMPNILRGVSPVIAFRSSSDEEDENGVNYGAVNDENSIFRDSGYHDSSVLPGIIKKSDKEDLAKTSRPHSSVTHQIPRKEVPSPPSPRKEFSMSPKSPTSPTSVYSPSPETPNTYSQSPRAGIQTSEYDEKLKVGRVLNYNKNPFPPEKTGEATSFLRRLKQNRRSSTMSSASNDSGNGSIFSSWTNRKGRTVRKSDGAEDLHKEAGHVEIS